MTATISMLTPNKIQQVESELKLLSLIAITHKLSESELLIIVIARREADPTSKLLSITCFTVFDDIHAL